MLRRILLIAALTLVATPIAASEGLRAVEGEFRETIRRVFPAAITCRPYGVDGARGGFSSGVVVSPDGLILSDADAGLVWLETGDLPKKSWRDDVEVRLAQGLGRGYQTFRGRVLFRDAQVDTSLIQLLNVQTALAFVPPGRSDQLRVGDFALTLGTTFDKRGGSPPTMTAGLVSAFTYLDATAGADNRYEFVYTSAAVNLGINGGPMVDLRGRLVATVSTFLDPEPDEPFQFLGKAVPIDRIRHAMMHIPQAQRLFAQSRALPMPPLTSGRALEEVFHDAGQRGYAPVVSMDIRRRRAISPQCPVENKRLDLPRYVGAVSAISISRDGYVVTSLHNMTNLSSRVRPHWTPPAGGSAEDGLKDVLDATIYYAPGVAAPAHLVGTDLRLGIALWKAELGRAGPHGVPYPAPIPRIGRAEAIRRGNLVLALGNPYGADRAPHPLLTMGIISKAHAMSAPSAWRGQWQTDASVIDTNAGGAVVDIEGRVIGMLTMWHPARHGRHSGIGFVIPWHRIERSVSDMRSGRSPQPALLGVEFAAGIAPVLATVTPGSAAGNAGLQPADRVRKLDGVATPTVLDAVEVVKHRFAGEVLRLTVERGGRTFDVDAVLQAR